MERTYMNGTYLHKMARQTYIRIIFLAFLYALVFTVNEQEKKSRPSRRGTRSMRPWPSAGGALLLCCCCCCELLLCCCCWPRQCATGFFDGTCWRNCGLLEWSLIRQCFGHFLLNSATGLRVAGEAGLTFVSSQLYDI